MSAAEIVAPLNVGDPHYFPWLAAAVEGVDACHYCEEPFTSARPPTFDHLVPRFSGGTTEDGTVMACQSCNGARGAAPYDAYMACVEAERALAKLERRNYRRPKFRASGFTLNADGTFTVHGVVTSLPRRVARGLGL